MNHTATTNATNPPEPVTRVPRAVLILGWVSFFADVSGEMIYPLLPLFLVGALGGSATSLGWIEGVAQATVALLTAWAGWRSDRIRRRVPYIRWGYGLPVVGKSILAAAFAWPMVLLGRTVDRVGKGLRSSPRDALIADCTPGTMRGRGFGLHRAMDTAGALVGALASAFLLWWLMGSPQETSMAASANASGDASAFRLVFALAAGLGLVSLGLTFLVREPEHAGGPEPAPAEPNATLATSTRAPLGRRYWIVVAVLLLFAVANSSDTFLLLRSADVGLSPWVVVLAYAFYNLLYSLVSYPAGALSDRIGRWRVIGIGWAIYAIVYVGFALTGDCGIWPLFAGYGLFMALTDGVGKALISDHAPAERRGLAMGLFYSGLAATTLLSSVVAGALWDRVGHAAPFWFGAIGACVALALLPLAAWWTAPSSATPHNGLPD